jgi:site-specific DNA recombinase
MTIRAAIYCRISSDRDGEALGVERQEKDCRELAERLGWEVAAVFVDNDISASTRSKKPRPQYGDMIRRAQRREFGAVLAYSNSRLTRRPRELEDLIDLHDQHGVKIHTAVSGNDDLSTADGRMVARIKANVDAAEAERTAERVVRAKAQAAEQGKYRGGRRPFGYNSDGVTINKKEAEFLRYAAKSLLAGRSLNAVVRDLNEKGSQTSTKKPWDTHTLRPVLLRARNAGLIQRGPVWHREPDIIGKAQWPAILDEEEWRAVHKLLTNPARLSAGAGASEPKWLGSGIFTCGRPTDDGGVCGATMRVCSVGQTPARPNHSRLSHYRCAEKAHLTVSTEHADAHVREEVARIVRDPRIVRLMTAGEHDGMQPDRERRALLVKRLEQTEADYDDDLIDARRYKSKVEKINAELIEVEERLAEGVQQAAVLPIFSSVDPGQAFLDSPIDIQRAVLRAVLRVEVLPATAPRRVWKDDRLRLSPVA